MHYKQVYPKEEMKARQQKKTKDKQQSLSYGKN